MILILVAKYPPMKVRGMDTMNQRVKMEKKLLRGMAPVEPVCLIKTLTVVKTRKTIPGKYVDTRQHRPLHPSCVRIIMAESHTETNPALAASRR